MKGEMWREGNWGMVIKGDGNVARRNHTRRKEQGSNGEKLGRRDAANKVKNTYFPLLFFVNMHEFKNIGTYICYAKTKPYVCS